MTKRLMRSEKDKQIAGVAAGVADYFDADVTVVRILFILFTLAGGPGILAYIIASLVIPVEDDVSNIKEKIVVEKTPMAV